ncbi:hypothetical protein ACGC1H_003545 [Rhizoctonia solani]
MPTNPPSRTTSDVGRQPGGSSKPKKKGKVEPKVVNGAFSDDVSFNTSTAAIRQPSPLTAPQKKGKAKNKPKKKEKKPHTTSIFDRFVQLVLLGYLIFTVQQCHKDTELKSPVCKAVQQRILQPLVYKPYHLLVTHPSVAPAIEASKPYYAQALKASQPLVEAAHKAYVVRVAPHVAQLEKHTRPYVRNLKFHYTRSVAPVLRTIQVYYTQLQNTVEPYINQAIAALIRLWLEIQPKIIPLIKESKLIPEWMHEHALTLMRLREQYVDKHVHRMLKKVEELGESRETKSLKADNHITKSPTSSFQHHQSEPAPTSVTEAAPTQAPKVEPTAITITPAAITPEGPIIPDGPVIPDGPIAPDAPEPVPDAPEPVAAATPEADDDLDAWIESLRTESTPTPEPEAQPVVEPTKEELAEQQRLKTIATAEKRADIESRHTKYEEELRALGHSAVDDLETFVSAVRSVAAADLGRRARDHIDTLNKEADKGLKGTEAYLQKLKAMPEGGAIKIAMLDNLVEKVEKKFLETAQNVSDTVSGWWSEMRDEEQKEANTAAEAIKSFALEAQSNLGMDYAWLDDVTVQDWTRYHALADTSDAFSKELQSLVDNTHPRSQPNPLEKGLEGLQAQLNDIVDDFQSKLKDAHMKGMRSFGSVNPDVHPASESTAEPEQSAESVIAQSSSPVHEEL